MKKRRGLAKFIAEQRKKEAIALQKRLLQFETLFSRQTVDANVLAVVTSIAQARHILAAVYGRPKAGRT